MEMDQETSSRICAWAEKDGCAVGSVLCHAAGGDVSASLVSTLWKSVQRMGDGTNIIFVRSSTLEAQVLEHRLKAAGGDGEFSGVAKAVYLCEQEKQIPRDTVVIMTYVQLSSLLTNARCRSTFPRRAIIVFEHELGWGLEEAAAREQVAFIVKGFMGPTMKHSQLKLLGISYHAKSSEWLKGVMDIVAGPEGTFTVEIKSIPRLDTISRLSRAALEGEGLVGLVDDIMSVLIRGKTVIVFGGKPKWIVRLFEACSDKAADAAIQIKRAESFLSWPDCALQTDMKTVHLFNDACGIPVLAAIPTGAFATPLPVEKLGLVVHFSDAVIRKTYDHASCVCAPGLLSPPQQELVLGGKMGVWSRPEDAPRHILCYSQDEYDRLLEDASRIPGGLSSGSSPLPLWLGLVDMYPSRPKEEIPLFGSHSFSAEFVNMLRIMELVQVQEGRLSLTETGRHVVTQMNKEETRLWRFETLLALEIGAARERDLKLDLKVLCCINRLSLINEFWEDLVIVKELRDDVGDFNDLQGHLVTGARFGGPGIERLDRGMLWAVWVAFEDATRGHEEDAVDALQDEIEPRMGAAGNAPPPPAPFLLRKDGILQILDAERYLRQPPTAQIQNWGRPLSDEEEVQMGRVFARANYSKLLAHCLDLKPNPGMQARFFRTHLTPLRLRQVFKWDRLVIASWRQHSIDIKSERRTFGGVVAPGGFKMDKNGHLVFHNIFLIPKKVLMELWELNSFDEVVDWRLWMNIRWPS